MSRAKTISKLKKIEVVRFAKLLTGKNEHALKFQLDKYVDELSKKKKLADEDVRALEYYKTMTARDAASKAGISYTRMRFLAANTETSKKEDNAHDDYIIRNYGRIPQKYMAETLGRSKQSLNRRVQKLIEKGMLTKKK